MKIQTAENVLKANDAVAAGNRRILAGSKLLAVNLMSAPGSGKTTLLEKTLARLRPDHPAAVLVGDLQTSRDAERLDGLAVETIQINTGTGCHLSAPQVAQAIAEIDLTALEYLFIENVGNMVCPAAFDLGEHRKVGLLSVPEGDDKVAKYYTLFQQADAVLLTKIDLIGVLDFNEQRVRDDLAKLNTRAPFVRISARTGEGLDEWIAWLREQRAAVIAERGGQ
ncbi:MAG TPA: hydrogenase nickel incorporation protein HypB [Phycisphaerae bacterium]|nr:hydrogenase nickel incorporation protein HypB [Phycisphaerae bacterium]